MNLDTIAKLSVLVPPVAEDYFTPVPPINRRGYGVPPPIGFALASMDPSFGVHFGSIMSEYQLPLPEWMDPGPLRDYAEALQSKEPFSPAVEEAIELSGTSLMAPPAALTRPIVNLVNLCLLSWADLDAISRRTGFSPAGLHAYNELFFNVRGRENDSLYLAAVLHQEINLGPLLPDHPLRTCDLTALARTCAEMDWPLDEAVLLHRPTMDELGFHTEPAVSVAA